MFAGKSCEAREWSNGKYHSAMGHNEENMRENYDKFIFIVHVFP